MFETLEEFYCVDPAFVTGGCQCRSVSGDAADAESILDCDNVAEILDQG
jgi:hypothetical protein